MRTWVWALSIPFLVVGTQTPATPDKAPTPLKQGPLAYYKGHCARCHGDLGGAYPDDFTKTKSKEDLTQVIESMAAGQGGAPLTVTAELEAQVAFHYAIDQKTPFLSWTSADGNTLKGEVTPDTVVTATVAGVDQKVEILNRTWKITLPANAVISSVVVHAKTDTSEAVLDLGKSSVSHAVPTKKTAIE